LARKWEVDSHDCGTFPEEVCEGSFLAWVVCLRDLWRIAAYMRAKFSDWQKNGRSTLMIAVLFLKRFAGALFSLGLFVYAILGGLQLTCVQNFLVGLASGDGVVVTFGKVSGFFPFDFSVDTLKISRPDFFLEVQDASIKLSKKLTRVNSVKLKNAKFESYQSKEMSFSDISKFIPVVCQNFVKCIEINSLQTQDTTISNISFRRDKDAKSRILNLRINGKNIRTTFNIDGSKIFVTSNYEKISLRAEYETSEGALGINVLDQDSGKSVNFDGFLIADSVEGAVKIPHLKFNTECKLLLHGTLLDAKIAHKDSGCRASAQIEMSNQIINIKRCNFGDDYTIMPFKLTKDLKVKEVDLRCKSGTVNLKDVDLSTPKFSIGSIEINNICLSDWLGESVSGTVSGLGKYTENIGIFNAQVSSFKLDNIKVPHININGKCYRSAIDAKIACKIFGKENIFNAKVSLDNWIPSKNSKIDLKWNGSVELIERNVGEDQIIGGSLLYDIKVAGPLWKPSVSGVATFANGSYMNLKTSTYVKDISANLIIKDNSVLIEKIVGYDAFAKNGSVKGSGKITPVAKSLNVDLRLALHQFGVVGINNFDGKLSGDINVKGDILKSIGVSGDLYADKCKFDISSLMTRSNRSVSIVNTVLKEKTKSKPMVLPIKVPLNIKITLKDGINVTGNGVNSIWKGGGSIFGDISMIQYDGKIILSKGTMVIPGHKVLKLRNGVISTSSSEPGVWNVDVSAVRSFDTINVGARLIQNKFGSDIKFFSTPYVPKKDVISYMLFGRPSSDISTSDGIALLLVMNRTSEGRPNIIDSMRSLFGVDEVEVKKAANGNPDEHGIISIGKSIGNKAKISVDREGGSGATKVVLESKLSKGTKVSVDMSRKDAIGAGISWYKRY
jgi:hypothetical protein